LPGLSLTTKQPTATGRPCYQLDPAHPEATHDHQVRDVALPSPDSFDLALKRDSLSKRLLRIATPSRSARIAAPNAMSPPTSRPAIRPGCSRAGRCAPRRSTGGRTVLGHKADRRGQQLRCRFDPPRRRSARDRCARVAALASRPRLGGPQMLCIAAYPAVALLRCSVHGSSRSSHGRGTAALGPANLWSGSEARAGRRRIRSAGAAYTKTDQL
jgi:hypothetical protein